MAGFAAGVYTSPGAYSLCSFIPVLRRTVSAPPAWLTPLIFARNTAVIIIVYAAARISPSAAAFIAGGVSAATGFLCGYGVTPPLLSACLTLPHGALELAALAAAYYAGVRHAGIRLLSACLILLLAAALMEVFATPRICLILACTLCK